MGLKGIKINCGCRCKLVLAAKYGIKSQTLAQILKKKKLVLAAKYGIKR